MRRLEVDFDEIQKAMEDVQRDLFDYYLDLETGEVLVISEEILLELKDRLSDGVSEEEQIEYVEFDEEPTIPDWMADEMEDVLEIVLDEEGRYVRIPERETRRAYQTMREFIATVRDADLRRALEAASDGKGAFKKFKDTLVGFPRERKRWHGFNAKEVRKEIREWLMSLGIHAVPLKKAP